MSFVTDNVPCWFMFVCRCQMGEYTDKRPNMILGSLEGHRVGWEHIFDLDRRLCIQTILYPRVLCDKSQHPGQRTLGSLFFSLSLPENKVV